MSKKQKKKLLKIISASILTIIAYFVPVHNVWRIAIFLIPYIIVGYDVLWTAVRNILHGQIFDEKLLMSIATIGAFVLRDYPEAVAVMIFYQIGELFQSIAVGKSRRSVAELMDIAPLYAVVVRNNEDIKVDPENVLQGEIILIKPGEKIPLDGEIIEGQSSVNTSALTGESLPVNKCIGDSVISGSINLNGLIKVRTTGAYENSTVAKILELVENSSQRKAKVESFITRFARIYTPCVVIGALLLAIIPPLLFSQQWSEWINRALLFLVVSCPCALVVSVPLSFFGGIGGASRKGILIKGANYMETLSKVDTFAFDKTGTITEGSFFVKAVHPSEHTQANLLDIAATAESYSNHPVALSIIKAHGKHIDKSRIGKIEEVAGMGIRAFIDGKTYNIGNGKLMDMVGATWHECHLVGTVVHISEESNYLGHITISDKVKDDSAKAISDLKKQGIKQTIMLTGDNKKVTDEISDNIGIDKSYSHLLPAQKVEEIENLIKSGSKVCFVGDGINDAPVLSRADVGIAMGALGSDAAIESADIVLMDDKLTKLPLAIKICRKTMRIVNQNIWFALSVKAVILVLGALGYANMWIAVFGDVGVMILAIINSMRCMIIKE